MSVHQLLSFVYSRLIEELQGRWQTEIQAALVGWHVAGAMSDGEPPARPDLPEWPAVKSLFDEWLLSSPDGVAHGADVETLPPEQLDMMIAFGWRE